MRIVRSTIERKKEETTLDTGSFFSHNQVTHRERISSYLIMMSKKKDNYHAKDSKLRDSKLFPNKYTYKRRNQEEYFYAFLGNLKVYKMHAIQTRRTKFHKNPQIVRSAMKKKQREKCNSSTHAYA